MTEDIIIARLYQETLHVASHMSMPPHCQWVRMRMTSDDIMWNSLLRAHRLLWHKMDILEKVTYFAPSQVSQKCFKFHFFVLSLDEIVTTSVIITSAMRCTTPLEPPQHSHRALHLLSSATMSNKSLRKCHPLMQNMWNQTIFRVQSQWNGIPYFFTLSRLSNSSLVNTHMKPFFSRGPIMRQNHTLFMEQAWPPGERASFRA